MTDISTNATAVLNQYIDSGITFVVDFFAHWCGPCKLLGPQLKALCVEKKIPLLLINGDHKDIHVNREIQGIMNTFGISAFPTVLIFKKGLKNPIKIVGVNMQEIKSHL